VGAGRVNVEQIVEEKVSLPKMPLPKELPKGHRGVLGLISELKKILDLEPQTVEGFVLSEYAGLPTLLVGPHGSGKTTLARVFFSALRIGDRPLRWKYINVKEMHTEYSIYARLHFGKLVKGEEEWVPVSIDCDAVFIDEVLRNMRVFSALNEILEEGSFEGMKVKWKFVVCASNPPNQYYQNVSLANYADLDRFASIIPVEDTGFSFAEKMARGESLEPSVKIDVSNIDEVRREIKAIPVSAEALNLAVLMVAAFSVCGYEDARTGSKCLIFNKFSVLSDLKCYRCVNRRHKTCPKYAVAPKRALRSLLSLAKARAWCLGRQVEAEDVAWAFAFTVPGRAAIISPEVRETVPTYRELCKAMLRDFSEWYSEVRDLILRGGDAEDPVVRAVKRFIKKERVLRGYRVVAPAEKLKRVLKYFVSRGTSIEEVTEAYERVAAGLAAEVKGALLKLRDGSLVVEVTSKEEAERLCRYLKES